MSYSAQRLISYGEFDVFSIDLYDIGLLLAGLIIFIASLLPGLVSEKRLITVPIFYMGLGVLVFILPWAPLLPDLVDDVAWLKRVAELGVILSLTSAGLKLNSPFAWASWRISWRLLVLTMPLTVAASAWLGWWAAGLLPASAILLGAVISPTDPVLAGDVEVRAPDEPQGPKTRLVLNTEAGIHNEPERSKTRLALTTEAGINDSLAFPFTNLAIAVALVGLAPSGWVAGWLAVDVFYKLTVGAVIGASCGYLIAKIILSKFMTAMTGVLALSLTLVPYGFAELASSYGFIAVFVAACVFRHYERNHQYQQLVHDFAEQTVRVLVAVLMFFVGAYGSSGALNMMTPGMWGVALAIVFLIRPLTSMLALVGSDLSRKQRWAISFFGIRGIGSVYYLAYGLFHVDFPDARALWSIVLAVIIISIVIHGISAPSVMKRLDLGR
ncbi:NhaP-type Na+/H+ or K+/H+ antiporter [Geoalkalibacter ferrihydriticus]|uniref:NhaP-type Na+/H+ or K+/H+ antiporter n=1 Tax=Geoalkalibacter ferrihydriticus TaxID=392333 RepID=A0A1G9R7Z6_9BACT|nr:cation:proton antiporter [Geoalkalibacter ferrihydriticus]SDM18555.1 NhaP-type Na+/H+ or K+/H+ antiporter [Geoalkalibacter ferrihydriticus]